MSDSLHPIPINEWESVLYPIVLTNITFERDNIRLPDDTIVEIWRDDNYLLKGRISGNDFYHRIHNRNEFIGKGNIIADEKIIATDTRGNVVRINGCAIGNLIKENPNQIADRQILTADLILDSLNIVYGSDSEGDQNCDKRYDWFLVAGIEPFFDGTTFRKINESNTKIRLSVDDHKDDTLNYIGSTFSKDFSILKLDDIECIIAQAPNKYICSDLCGICFEFRGDNVEKASQQFIVDLKHFIGFLLGCKLHDIGYTIVSDGQVREVYIDDPKLKSKLRTPMPPIQYTMRYDWGKFWLLINQLFPKYLELQKKLQLNQALSRYWISGSLPIGVNLPILASAIEILAANYLKMTGNDKLTYLSEDDYLGALGLEFDEIKSRLLAIAEGQIIVNKILGNFRKGSNENIRKFFSLLGLNIGKDEKAALNLRNKMTHSARDYSDDNTVHQDVFSTRVYEVLFNRTALKILGYGEYYKDYSQKNCPSKHISMGAGSTK